MLNRSRARARIRPLLRVAGATSLTAAVLAVPFGAFPAAAWAATPANAVPVQQTAWFWTHAQEQVTPPVAPPAAPASEPSGVPAGDLAVAYTGSPGGASSKLTLVQLAVPTAAAGGTVTGSTLALTLDPSSSATNVNAAGAPVEACLPTRAWSSGAGQDSGSEPPVNCANAVKGTWAGNTVTFALTPLASTWVSDVNLGVAIVNQAANSTPYQAVFAGGSAVVATFAYTPAAPVAQPTPAASTPAGVPTQVSTTPSTVGPPATQPQPSLTLPGPAVVPSTAPASAPAVAPVGSAPTTPSNNAARATLPSASANFWPLGILLGLLVVVIGFVLRDRSFVAPSDRPTGRLGKLVGDPERVARLRASAAPAPAADAPIPSSPGRPAAGRLTEHRSPA